MLAHLCVCSEAQGRRRQEIPCHHRHLRRRFRCRTQCPEPEFRNVVCGAWLSNLYSGIHPGSRNESVRAARRPFEGVRCHPPLIIVTGKNVSTSTRPLLAGRISARMLKRCFWISPKATIFPMHICMISLKNNGLPVIPVRIADLRY